MIYFFLLIVCCLGELHGKEERQTKGGIIIDIISCLASSLSPCNDGSGYDSATKRCRQCTPGTYSNSDTFGIKDV